MVVWIDRECGRREWPVPIVAALAHCQFEAVHPYFDGNGRTARLLTKLILHRGDYGLKGIYSLEEYYARNLASYYEALDISSSHNYYMGRADVDVTKFIEYFIIGMADSFAKVRARAQDAGRQRSLDRSPRLRELSAQQRNALRSVFLRFAATITAKEVAAFFSVSSRSAGALQPVVGAGLF